MPSSPRLEGKAPPVPKVTTPEVPAVTTLAPLRDEYLTTHRGSLEAPLTSRSTPTRTTAATSGQPVGNPVGSESIVTESHDSALVMTAHRAVLASGASSAMPPSLVDAAVRMSASGTIPIPALVAESVPSGTRR